jgi:hypothetical protein
MVSEASVHHSGEGEGEEASSQHGSQEEEKKEGQELDIAPRKWL